MKKNEITYYLDCLYIYITCMSSSDDAMQVFSFNKDHSDQTITVYVYNTKKVCGKCKRTFMIYGRILNSTKIQKFFCSEECFTGKKLKKIKPTKPKDIHFV